jgi:hypothetical protein
MFPANFLEMVMGKSRDLYSKCSVQRCISNWCRGAFLKGAEVHFLKDAEVHFLKDAEVQRSQVLTLEKLNSERRKKVFIFC